MTPGGTSNELGIHNKLEEKKHTHTHTLSVEAQRRFEMQHSDMIVLEKQR